ncbi:phage tail tape measure protein [Clostridium thermosuccinogenes]|uniref:phage tail tape measure protein n=1 Tax=Clostridium thermosuccinogenes TaxID=84032 RepID=UPI000CCBE4CB|nr:phage tail tape measure protein [Pseudoclostridium thermosuccinogenes]PNT94145.1 hypothetical protein CDQ83_11900 [Pseudoclostridium thermosuccinogenes]
MALLDLGKLGFDLVLNKSGWNKDFKEADKDIEEHQSKWSAMASKIGGGIKTGIIGAVTGITAAVTGMAVAGAKSAIELQDHMQKFQSATGMTSQEVDKVKKTVQELYKVNEDSYEDIAATVTALRNNMGMTAQEIEKYAQNYLNYAKVTGQANEEAVGAIDDLGDAWGLTADESISAMDKLLVLNQQFGMSVTDAQASLTKMAPAAKAVGLSMDEASAYLAMFAQTGIDAQTASTAFTKALQTVKSPEELKKLISDIQNTDDSFQRAQLASELFGVRAGPQMAQALAESDVSIDNFIESMNNTAGAVTNASEEYDKSLKVQLELMKKQFSGLFEELAERLMPIINKLLDWVIANMPQIQEILSTVFNTVGDIISSFVSIVQGVIDVFVDWLNENTEVTNQYITMFNQFKEWFVQIFDLLKQTVSTVLEAIKTLWQKYGDDILAVIKPAWDVIVKTVDFAIKQVRQVLDVVIKLISGDWKGAWDGIKQYYQNTWQYIKDIIPSLLNGIYAALKGAFNVFKDIGKGMFNMIWEGMKGIWSSISNWISEKVSWLTDKLMFWKKSSNEMSTSTSNHRIDGSHASGLAYVPYDGYIAELHKGEAVLTAEENKAYRTGIGVNENNLANAIVEGLIKAGITKPANITLDGKQVGRGLISFIDTELHRKTNNDAIGRGMLAT